MRVFVAAAAAALVIASSAAAVPPDSTLSETWSSPSWTGLLKVTAVLAVVLALVWLTVGLLKRAMGLKGGALSGVQLLGGLALGQRRALQFIKVAGKVHLLGITDHHISLISTVDDPAEVEKLTAGFSRSGSDPFAAVFRRVTGKRANPPEASA